MAEVTQPQVDETTARLMAEHRRLGEAMAALQATRDLPDLIGRLEAFRVLLTQHFLSEVEPGGFFDTLRSRASLHYERLSQLEREHCDLLQEVTRVEDAARACLAGPVAAVLAGAADLVGHLKRHEAGETELFMDTLYTDIAEN
jgi:hypothetical protein